MTRKKKSKIKKWTIVIICAVIVIGIISFSYFRRTPAFYERTEAKSGDITTYYSFSGNIEAKNRETVMSEKVQQISEINVQEGDLVEEGDVLMKSTTGDEITASISGEVANLSVEENAQVISGMKLLEIVDYNNLEVNVKVDEYDISSVTVGKEATVTISALGKELPGKISSVSKEGQVQNGVTVFFATIDLEPDESLRVGLSAEVKLESNHVTGEVILPMSEIQFDDNNKPYVLKEDENGKAVRTEIETGINDGTNVEIKSGIAEGDIILKPDTAKVTNGMGLGFRRNRDLQGGNN